jgi:DNA polymerase III sliding clamp (beta) subunit (PCNA family)
MSLEFSVRAADLSAVLGPMASLASRKPTIEVLKYVRMTAQGGRVHLDATDTVVRQSAAVPSTVTAPGVALLPAHRLHALVKLVGADETVTFTQKAKGTQVALGATKVMFQAPEVTDFPNGNEQVETDAVVTVPAGVLRRLTTQVRPGVPHQDFKAAPAGLSLVVDERQVLSQATDGSIALEASSAHVGTGRLAWILPAQATSDLLAFLDTVKADSDVAIAATSDVFVATAADVRFSSTVVAKTFPSMERLFSRKVQGSFTVNREELSLALKRMAVVHEQSTNNSVPSVRLAASSAGLVVSAYGPQTGDATEHLAIEHTGEDWQLKLSSRYLLDFLRVATGDRVTLEFTGVDQPTIWRDMGEGPFQCLIAVMRS